MINRSAFVETRPRDGAGIALIQYGLRTMRRSPLFSATAAGTIALATASIATVASLANALLWRRLPVERADEIVSVTAVRAGRRTDANFSPNTAEQQGLIRATAPEPASPKTWRDPRVTCPV